MEGPLRGRPLTGKAPYGYEEGPLRGKPLTGKAPYGESPLRWRDALACSGGGALAGVTLKALPQDLAKPVVKMRFFSIEKRWFWVTLRFTGKAPYGEGLYGKARPLRGRPLTGKAPYGEGPPLTGKAPYGEGPLRGRPLTWKAPYGEGPLQGRPLTGKAPYGEGPLRGRPLTALTGKAPYGEGGRVVLTLKPRVWGYSLWGLGFRV